MRKANPLKQGYSRATIRENIRNEIQRRKPRNQAVASAYKTAREVWRKRNKGKTMPAYLRRANPADYQSVLVEKSRRRAVKKTRPKTSKHANRGSATKRRRNPLVWVIQAVNANTGKQGYYTGQSIDTEKRLAKHYRSAKAAQGDAVKMARGLPRTWVPIVTHVHP